MTERQNQTVNLTTLKKFCTEVTDAKELFRGNTGSLYLKVHTEETRHCAPPANLADDDEAAKKFIETEVEIQPGYDISIGEVYLASLADARLSTLQSLLFSQHGLIFADSYHRNDFVVHPMARTRDIVPVDLRFAVDGEELAVPTRIARFSKSSHRIEEPALLLTSPWCEGYHHWIFETLSRLWAVEKYPQLKDIPLVAPVWMKPFHLEILEAFGVDAGRLILFDGQTVDFDRLYVPSFLAPGGVSGRQIAWLRTKFFHAFDVDPPATGHRRLYLTRTDVGSRDVANLDELAPILADHGFETVAPGVLSVAKQINLFAEADVIVAPHGSALTNHLFTPANARLIELFPSSYINPFYWRLCAVRGQDYAFLIGEDMNEKQDFEIDGRRLKALLADIPPAENRTAVD